MTKTCLMFIMLDFGYMNACSLTLSLFRSVSIYGCTRYVSDGAFYIAKVFYDATCTEKISTAPKEMRLLKK